MGLEAPDGRFHRQKDLCHRSALRPWGPNWCPGLERSPISPNTQSRPRSDWQATTLWPALRPVFWMLVRTPPEDRDAAALHASIAQTERAMILLDAHLGTRSFVGGERFTMGDVPVGVSAHRWYALAIDRLNLPHLRRWYERLLARPSFREVVAVPLT